MRQIALLRSILACGVVGCTLSALEAAEPQANDAVAPASTGYEVGLAKVDITPEYPIRLSGFSSRQTESEGVRQRIYARAMAVRTAGESAVLVTVDSIGIPLALRDEVAQRLQSKRKIANERLAICSTHSHTAPSLNGVLPTMFGARLPEEHEKRIERYTRELTDRIEQAALAALDDLQPSRVSFSVGKVGFAINRRARGGPVDHDLPVLSVLAPDGKIRGLWVGYACHCVVLSDFKVSGDWAGCASDELEKQYSDSVALVSIGCGADANPDSGVTGDKGEVAQQYGAQIAAEVERLLRTNMTEIQGALQCTLQPITLPLAPLPSRDEWVERSKIDGVYGYYARYQLARLDQGEKLPTEISYPIQTWQFGQSLAVVFLPGEVVVDYSLRLKKDFDASRLWINAYANDAPAYIPSERILKEGGYEAGVAMHYYGLPAWFAPGLEARIIFAIDGQLDDAFQAD